MAARGTLTQLRFAPHAAGTTRPAQMVHRAWATLAEMRRARRTRRLLAEMDDRMLADIGIGRGDALMEASRAPWDVSRR